MTIPTAVYITGAGKCGTHLAGAYFEANGAGCEVERKELKGGPASIDGRLRPGTCFVFHCPGVDIENFRSRVPEGRSIILARHPVQNYLSWVIAESRRVITQRSWLSEKENINWRLAAGEAATIFHRALYKVVRAFQMAPRADYVWRIEDFTASPERRQKLFREVFPSASGLSEQVALSNRTAFGWTEGIVPIQGNEYPLPLIAGERRALECHDPIFSAWYPDWQDGIKTSPRPDRDVLRDRFLWAHHTVGGRKSHKRGRRGIRIAAADFLDAVALERAADRLRVAGTDFVGMARCVNEDLVAFSEAL